MALSKILPASQDQYAGARNLIINGAMQVAQRGTSTSGTTTSGYYTTDRWQIANPSLGTWTVSQSTTAPNGFSNSFKMDCTTADASPASSDFLMFRQNIEAQNLQHLQYGTASAQSLTLSFWVRSSKTGTYIAELLQLDATNRHINKAYTISSADTWEYKTITFAGDTSGVINNDNGTGFQVNWWLDAGSNYTGGTLQTSWGAITPANRAVGQVNLADSTSNDWHITGVQLELGSTATNFEHRSFGDELLRCQRYYWQFNQSNSFIYASGEYATNNHRLTVQHPVTMRTEPSVVAVWGTGTGQIQSYNVFAISFYSTSGFRMGTSSGSFKVDAEL